MQFTSASLSLVTLGFLASLGSAAPQGTPTIPGGPQQLGPWGSSPSTATFNDKNYLSGNFPGYAKTTITCRSHGRLDYIKFEYKDAAGRVLKTEEHGDANAGDGPVSTDIGKVKDIAAMRAHVCIGGKHDGKVCGVTFQIRDRQAWWRCGRTDTDTTSDAHFYSFMSNQRKFMGLVGSTTAGGREITSLGWWSTPLTTDDVFHK